MIEVPAPMPPPTPKIKDSSDYYENKAVDRHNLMRGISEPISRIRATPEEMPNKQRYSGDQDNYPAGLHHGQITPPFSSSIT